MEWSQPDAEQQKGLKEEKKKKKKNNKSLSLIFSKSLKNLIPEKYSALRNIYPVFSCPNNTLVPTRKTYVESLSILVGVYRVSKTPAEHSECTSKYSRRSVFSLHFPWLYSGPVNLN